MKRLFLFALCILISVCAAAQGKTYYVSPSGNDASTGLSIKDAWKTIEKANAFVFQPGSGAFADGSEAGKDAMARMASQIAWTKWMFPASIASNNPSGPVLSLSEPLEPEVQGTLSWQAPGSKKPVVVDLARIKDRQRIALPIKADAQTLEGTTLKVTLTNGRFSDAFEVPFEAQRGRRR